MDDELPLYSLLLEIHDFNAVADGPEACDKPEQRENQQDRKGRLLIARDSGSDQPQNRGHRVVPEPASIVGMDMLSSGQACRSHVDRGQSSNDDWTASIVTRAMR